MITAFVLLVTTLLVLPSKGQPAVDLSTAIKERTSKIESVEIMVADCHHCGMSPLGHIHVKVCLVLYGFLDLPL